MPDRPENVIKVEHFSFRFGGKEILRDVSFSVRRGESVAIVGPNGAGKTTLIKCLDRLLTGGTGHIEICGRPLPSYRGRELAQRISYVPQADGRVPFVGLWGTGAFVAGDIRLIHGLS